MHSRAKPSGSRVFPSPANTHFSANSLSTYSFCLLPFGLIGEFDKISPNHDWLTIPFSNLISWVFMTMEKVGDTSENPFEASLNDVPMTTICRNIEIDLKTLLGEDELPQPLQPEEHVLM